MGNMTEGKDNNATIRMQLLYKINSVYSIFLAYVDHNMFAA